MTLGFTGYSALNGLGLMSRTSSGYGGYGYYGALADSTYVDTAKTSIANSYEIRSTNQSYNNLQQMEQSSLNFKCQTIKDMLQDGRSDDAVEIFNDLVQEMSELSQYQACDESAIRTKIHNQYATACGSTLLGDITRYSDSSFISGVKNSNPITMFLCQASSKADIKGQITGESVSNQDVFIKGVGAAVGGAGVAFAASGLHTLSKSWKAGKEAAKAANESGIGATMGKAVKELWGNIKGTTSGKVKGLAIAGALVGVGCLVAKHFYNKATKNTAEA